jgi:hypothetical protein
VVIFLVPPRNRVSRNRSLRIVAHAFLTAVLPSLAIVEALGNTLDDSACPFKHLPVNQGKSTLVEYLLR